MSVKGSQCWGPQGLKQWIFSIFVRAGGFFDSQITGKEPTHHGRESTVLILRLTWVAVECVIVLELFIFPTSLFPTLGRCWVVVASKGVSEP